MKERKLLLLGLLLAHSRHGYQINDIIEKNLSECVNVKRSTAYSTLDGLCSSGHVRMESEQVGNRPPRKVYTLTPSGRRLFDRLLREYLTSLEGFSMPVETALIYLDVLDEEERLRCLERRRQKLQGAIAALEAAPSHGHGKGIDMAISHRLTLMRAELDWLSAQEERLREVDAEVADIAEGRYPASGPWNESVSGGHQGTDERKE